MYSNAVRFFFAPLPPFGEPRCDASSSFAHVFDGRRGKGLADTRSPGNGDGGFKAHLDRSPWRPTRAALGYSNARSLTGMSFPQVAPDYDVNMRWWYARRVKVSGVNECRFPDATVGEESTNAV